MNSNNQSKDYSPLVAHFLFNKDCDKFRNVPDLSGNGITLKAPTNRSGFSPPKWSREYGVVNSGFKFYGNSSQSQFLYSDNVQQLLSASSGSICLWVHPFGQGNQVQSIISLSNGFVKSKTEFILQIDCSSKNFKASITKDGVVEWIISTKPGSLDLFLWSHVGLVHDGTKPHLYLNGFPVETIIETTGGTSKWLSSLSSAISIPTKLCIGATPRYYSPLMALGLFAYLDEIKIWEKSIPASEVKTDFETKT